MARQSYPREFKPQALRLITDQGLSIAEAAASASARTCSAPGRRPPRNGEPMPSPVTATCPAPRTH
jgi:hypothetical protein